ncbi:hypothetical protein VHEMI04290 [[Torrubiella] hemipterigena]|uniref:Uncharacterized protein n=1 Tax=[Torrubiella] hemipterigena TaxID=1531966 RepID=A0A0A1TDU8_9HYPO|nr:hypothetical protein VHEMI04290 [[Torrubiella] hemipterigena]
MPSIFSRLKRRREQAHMSINVDGPSAPGPGESQVATELHESNTESAIAQPDQALQMTSIEPNSDDSTTEAMQPLWTQAYLKIKVEDAPLMDEYEDVLLKELPQSVNASTSEAEQSIPEHCYLQWMREITDLGLRRMDEKTMKYHIAGNEYVVKRQVAQVSNAVLKLKSFIADAVSSSPAASVAVAGISMLLPLLTNPSTMDDANKSGTTYVISRMQFYIGIEEQLWPKCVTLSGDFRNKLEDDLISLYRAIIVLQIKSVLRFYRYWIKTTARDMARWDDWKTMQEDVKAAEVVVATYFDKLLQLDSRNLLHKLSIQADDNTISFQAILSSVNAIEKDMQMALRQQDNHHREKIMLVLTKEQQDCHQAFKTSVYERHKNINPDRVEGTCRWTLENKHYREWYSNGYNDLLWVSADPGCGKSVLAKSLIDKDLNETSASVCYFFFKDNDEQNGLTTALCAVLHQLFSYQPHLIRHALSAWQQNGDKIQQEEEQLWRIFMAAIADPAFKNTVCIFDALDECRSNDRGSLIKKLEIFYSQAHIAPKQGWLKFLVTSRPYDDIQRQFYQTTQSFPHIHIRGEDENALVHEEISLVIKLRVDELADRLQLDSDIHDRLEQQLLAMEHRTYLWLYLAMDDIETQFRNSLEPGEESIELIPTSVDAAYTKILEHVATDKKHDVELILQIIVTARRPLTIEEMAVALGIAMDHRSQSNRRSALRSQGLAEKIRHLCGLFVFMQDSRIYLIHQTAREFLLRKEKVWSFTQTDGDILLSKICISFLLQEDSTIEKSRKDTGCECFLEYAAVYWVDHARQIPSQIEAQLATQIDQLYDVNTGIFALWCEIYWDEEIVYPEQPQNNSNIIMAAITGHTHTIQRYIQCDPEAINTRSSNITSALYWASVQGYLTIVRLLLDERVDVNAQGGYYGNALQAACSEGYIDIVQLLLDEGADVNVQGGYYGNALQAACCEGYVDIVRLLLDEGADVNVQGGYYDNALQAACSEGHADIVRLLLDEGVDANAEGDKYGTVLIQRLRTPSHSSSDYHPTE